MVIEGSNLIKADVEELEKESHVNVSVVWEEDDPKKWPAS